MKKEDVVIVGAGPFGLAAAAHLGTIPGLRVQVFGEAMSFWTRNMPAGMLLRSPWCATHIADPKSSWSLDAYVAERGKPLPEPIPLECFVDYGRWFQQKAAPGLDSRRIQHIESHASGYRVTTQDGEVIAARRVVVATGIEPFAWYPEQFRGLPRTLVSHSGNHANLGAFANKRVWVVGGGQSSLESAALLHESGARVEVLVRNPRVRWLRWRGRLLRYGPLGHLFYSPRDVGPAGISQLVARPYLLRLFPRAVRDWIGKRSIRPAGSVWLVERLREVPIRTNVVVKSATPVGKQLRVILSDGTEELVDHLLFGTGYRIDITKYPFLSPEVLGRISHVNGYPRLKAGLESSAAGLHFLGAPAAWSFGPVARFVSGTYYCASALCRRVAESTGARR